MTVGNCELWHKNVPHNLLRKIVLTAGGGIWVQHIKVAICSHTEDYKTKLLKQ